MGCSAARCRQRYACFYNPALMNLPWIIWRSCFLELWRLVLLSAVVLVSVLAFGGAVRYIADGRLGPITTLTFISWAALPMLQYALPFAGGFGATLAYHRMAQDNELVAAGGGGVSHRAILMPALASGLLLGTVLMFLSSEVIPGFLQRMERMVARDISRMALRALQQGDALYQEGLMVHADSVRRLGPDPELGAYERFSLTGVAAVQVDPEGRIVSEATASHAMVWFAQVPAPPRTIPGSTQGPSSPVVTRVSLELRNAFRVNDREMAVIEALPLHFTRPQDVRDSPKYLNNRDLVRLPQNPDRMNHIDNMRRDLAVRIAESQTMRDINAALRRDGRMELMDADGRVYVIWARAIVFRPSEQAWALVPAQEGGLIEIERYHPAQGAALSSTRFTAESGVLKGTVVKEILERRVLLTLSLTNVRARSVTAEAASERSDIAIPRLSPTNDKLGDLLQLTSHQMIAEAKQRMADGRADPAVGHAAEHLEQRIARLEREVVSKLHERWASSTACLVMVLAGAVTAMRLGASLPLTVYLWSFFPALLSVLTISAGQHMARQMGLWGLSVVWSGVGILTLYTLIAFLLVRRH